MFFWVMVYGDGKGRGWEGMYVATRLMMLEFAISTWERWRSFLMVKVNWWC